MFYSFLDHSGLDLPLQVGVDDCKLVSGEDLQGVVNKIKNRDETSITDGCETLESKLPLLLQGEVVPWLVEVLGQELSKPVPHLNIVMVQEVFEGGDVELWPRPSLPDGAQVLSVGHLEEEVLSILLCGWDCALGPGLNKIMSLSANAPCLQDCNSIRFFASAANLLSCSSVIRSKCPNDP